MKHRTRNYCQKNCLSLTARGDYKASQVRGTAFKPMPKKVVEILNFGKGRCRKQGRPSTGELGGKAF